MMRQKRNRIRFLSAAMAVLMLVSVFPVGVFAAGVSLEPIADAYVSGKNPNTNYGDAEELLVCGNTSDEKIAFLTYENWHAAAGASLTLTLPVTVSGGGNISVYLFEDYSIDEMGLCYENMPSLSKATLVQTVAVNANGNVTVALPAVNGDYFTLAVTGEKVYDYTYTENFNEVGIQEESVSKNSYTEKDMKVLTYSGDTVASFAGLPYSSEVLGVTGSNGGYVSIVNAPKEGDGGIVLTSNALRLDHPRRLKFLNVFKASAFTSEDIDRTFVVTFRAISSTADTKIKAGYNTVTGYAAPDNDSFTLAANEWKTCRYRVTVTEAMINAGQVLFCLETENTTSTTATVYVDDIAVAEEGVYIENFDQIHDQISGVALAYDGYKYEEDRIPNQTTFYNRIYSQINFASSGATFGTSLSIEDDPTKSGRGKVLNSGGRRIKFANALKASPLTGDDLNKTYTISFDAYVEEDKTIVFGLMSWYAGGNAAGDPSATIDGQKYQQTMYQKHTKELTGGTWTTVSYDVTVDENMITAQIGCPTIDHTGSGNGVSFGFYVDNLRVVPKGGIVITSSSIEGGGTAPTVSADRASDILTIRPSAVTYVSKADPDASYGAGTLALADLDAVGLASYNIADVKGSDSLELFLPSAGSTNAAVDVYAVDASFDAASITYNRYTALGKPEVKLATIFANEQEKLDIADTISKFEGDTLTLVFKLARYEQNFTEIDGTQYLNVGSDYFYANADGIVEDWGNTYVIYADESDGIFRYRGGSSTGDGDVTCVTKDGNRFLSFKNESGGRVKLHNLFGSRMLTDDDLDKTYVISYKARTAAGSGSITGCTYSIQHVYAADKSTMLYDRTHSKKTESFEINDTGWTPITQRITVTEEMIKGQFAMYTIAYSGIEVHIDDLSSYVEGANAVFNTERMVLRHTHTFDKEVANEKTYAGDIPNSEKKYYYYSCSCGANGTERFEADHTCSVTDATATTPASCTVCGKVYGFPTDSSLNTRYSLDGKTWTYVAFADAMTAVNGQTATVEVYGAVSLAEGISVTGGNITIKSYDPNHICTITRGSSFKASMFAVSGSAEVVLEHITIAGGGVSPAINGGAFSISGTGAKVTMKDGTTFDGCKVGGSNEGGTIDVLNGATFEMLGGVIRGGSAKKGGGIRLRGASEQSPSFFIMKGGEITGCTTQGSFGHGAAVYMEKYATMEMSSGVISGNTSTRTDSNASVGNNVEGAVIDGAIAIYNSNITDGNDPNKKLTSKIILSGDAVIRHNDGYVRTGVNSGTSNSTNLGSKKFVDYADIAFFRDQCSSGANGAVTILKGFTGSVSIGHLNSLKTPGTDVALATGWKEGTVLHGVLNAHAQNEVAVVQEGKIVWTPAVAAVVDGDIETRYTDIAAAMSAAGDKPIILTADLAYTFSGEGDVLRVAENGKNVTFPNNFYTYETSTENVAINYGKDTSMSVTTYTAISMGGALEGASLTLGEDLTLYIYANLIETLSDAKLMVTRNGIQTLLTPEAYDSGYRYCFTAINPQCMGDVLTFELFDDADGDGSVDDNELLNKLEGYTVRGYCLELLDKNTEYFNLPDAKVDAMKSLINDLLIYGGAAQLYTGYNASNPVSTGIIGSTFPGVSDAMEHKVKDSSNAVFTAATAHFSNVNRLIFKFTTTDVTKTTVTIGDTVYTSADFKALGGNSYSVTTKPLYAKQLQTRFALSLSYDGVEVATLSYSLNDYIAYIVANSTDDKMAELAKATYNYGMAAKTFAETDPIETLHLKELAASSGKLLGSATANGEAVSLAGIASGVELAFYGEGDSITLNITASAGDRISVSLDGVTVDHIPLTAGETTYTFERSFDEGTHTLRVVGECGTPTLKSVSLVGYAKAVPAASKLFIEYVGGASMAGEMLYEESATDAAKSYAYLSALALDADYRIVKGSFAAGARVPNIVVLENANEASAVTAAYGDSVKIVKIGELGLTEDSQKGSDGLLSLGGSYVWAAELSAHIKDSYADLLPSGVSTDDDIILEVLPKKETFEYSSFDVYIKTSDPSDLYYMLYHFVYEYSDDYSYTYDDKGKGESDTTKNLNNYRVKQAFLMKKNGTSWTEVKPALHQGEISAAIKISTPGIGNNSDFVGGYHGDEWLSNVALYADGVEIDLQATTKQTYHCSSLIFDQKTTMYQCATVIDDVNRDDIHGKKLSEHTQHFTITAQGINNRQTMNWLIDGTPVEGACFLQMFTVFRDACESVSVYGDAGNRLEDITVTGTISESEAYKTTKKSDYRLCYYEGESGISSVATYQIPKLADNKAKLRNGWINVRQYGDNKMYMDYTSTTSNIEVGDVWVTDLTYGFDYTAK